MQTTFTDEQTDIQETTRRFARELVAPLAAELDRDARFPTEAWEKGAELGLLGLPADEQYGGAGLGLTETCIVAEELAAVCVSTAVTLLHQADMVVGNLSRNATEEQKRKFLPRLCSGEWVGCLAITEPEAGSDALAMRTRASRVDGGWLLDGTKTFITNAPVADLALVYAKTGPVDSRQMALFAVEAATPGFERGGKLDKMGWRGSPTGELILRECFVPEENLIGGEGEGIGVLISGLNSERITMAAQGVGIAQGALDASVGYAKERVQFGRRIGDFQLIQAKLADMFVDIEACRALVHRGATLADAGRISELRGLAGAAKLLGSEIAMRATTQAVQIFGGYGYTKEYPVERMMRDAKIMEIGGGTSEIQRTTIGKELLR
jgi:isovaleryl-CoA dehydrogenase